MTCNKIESDFNHHCHDCCCFVREFFLSFSISPESTSFVVVRNPKRYWFGIWHSPDKKKSNNSGNDDDVSHH